MNYITHHCSILRAEKQSVVIYGAVGADVGTSAPSSSDTNLLLYTKDTVWSLEAGVGGFVWLQGTFPVKLLKVITVITHNNHSFIQILPHVGNTRRQRERGGGSWLAGKGLGWKPAHTGEVAGPLTRLRRRRLTKVTKVGVEQGQPRPEPELTQHWPQPW